jgi:hypothetical protein
MHFSSIFGCFCAKKRCQGLFLHIKIAEKGRDCGFFFPTKIVTTSSFFSTATPAINNHSHTLNLVPFEPPQPPLSIATTAIQPLPLCQPHAPAEYLGRLPTPKNVKFLNCHPCHQ